MKLLLLFFTCLLQIIAAQKATSQTIPVLEWGGLIGGYSTDRVFDMAHDNANNIVTIGTVQSSADFDPGPAQVWVSGGFDLYFSKISASGQYLWAKRINCGTSSSGTSVAIDADDNIYVTGYFNGSGDFDPGPATLTFSTAGSFDFFVSKFSPNGDLIWAKKFGGTGYDQANGIAVDNFGHVLITGRFATDSVDFDPGPSEYKLGPGAGGGDIFLLNLDTAGNFNWAKSYGGNSGNPDISWAVTSDYLGNIYSTGYFFNTTDFDPGPGVYNLTAFNSDIYIQKLDSSGNFKWARSFGSNSAGELGRSIKTDAQGNVILCGEYWQTVDFDPSANVANLVAINGNAFVAKYDSLGNYIWAKDIGGGPNAEFGYDLAIDNNDNVLVTGMFQGSFDADSGPGTNIITAVGSADAYIIHLAANGDFVWAGSVGSTNQDIGYTVDVDNANQICWAGVILGTADIDPSSGINTQTPLGNMDIFITKFNTYIPLPLTITSFEGVGCDKKSCLTWTTQGEYNINKYEIERSAKGVLFETIGEHLSTRSMNQKDSYSYIDAKPFIGINYYRLKCIDNDNKHKYSIILSLEHVANGQIIVYPTISKEGIFYIKGNNRKKTIEVYNSTGSLIKQSTTIDVVNISTQPSGLYLLKIMQEGVEHIYKLIKE